MVQALKLVTDHEQLQHDFQWQWLAEWEKSWDMAFHPEKCTTLPVSVSTARKALKYPYQLHSHTLEATDSTGYLGITINKDMGWNTHINTTLGFLQRNLKIGLTS